ncbi:hypothetical protein MIR68_009778 [Amoeboaphelidium protococcarum]|nr:hypothetical protein MIR68_009778 [Amoeboaphelidium protococcarum]
MLMNQFDKKPVCILSSVGDAQLRDGKPNVVNIYNAAMPGVDKNDQMKFGRKTARRLLKKYYVIIYCLNEYAYIYQKQVLGFAHLYQELLEMLQWLWSQMTLKNIYKGDEMAPLQIGPFKAVRRTRGGSYKLLGADGSEITSSPSQMKLVYIDPLLLGELHAEVGTILAHRDGNCAVQYLVKWKHRDDSFNQWVNEKDFDSLQPIQAYRKALVPKQNSRKRRSGN